MATPTQLLLPLPKKHGWHNLPLVVSGLNQHTIDLVASPDRWQDGVLALVGEQGSGKSFLAWYLFGRGKADKKRVERIADGGANDPYPSDWLTDKTYSGRVVRKKHLAHLADAPSPSDPHPPDIIIWDNVAQDLPRLSPESAEGLCHFFNRPKELRPRLLLLSQRPLADMLAKHRATILPDLASRLGLVAQVRLLADDQSLRAQVEGFFAERQVAVDDKTITAILHHGPRSHATLHQLLARLDDTSRRTNKPIKQRLIQQWLAAGL